MFHLQANLKLWRNLCLAVSAAMLLTVASCSNQPTNVAANAAKKPDAAKPASVSTKPAQPPQLVTVPKGTPITATVGQTLAINKNHPGDSFAARLSTPVKVDGKIVIPKGTEITGKVVTVKKHELKVALASVKVQGKSYDLVTNSLRPSDKVQVKNAKASAADKTSQDKKDKDATLRAQTQLRFKLSKPVTVPVKG